jgi:hypothetical protein
MKAFLWRVVYAVICVVLALAIIPLFAQVVGFPIGGPLWELIRICIAGIAVVYAFFGGQPPAPW